MSKVEQWYVDNMKLGSGGLGEGQPSAADFLAHGFLAHHVWLTDFLAVYDREERAVGR